MTDIYYDEIKYNNTNKIKYPLENKSPADEYEILCAAKYEPIETVKYLVNNISEIKWRENNVS